MHSSTFFFFNDTATTEIYTLSLHDALPISNRALAVQMEQHLSGCHDGAQRVPTKRLMHRIFLCRPAATLCSILTSPNGARSEEHTSELQSRLHLVCRLLLEKKKQSRHTYKY